MDTGLKTSGGEGGIRTPDTLSGMPVFKTGAINHSATSPRITINNLAMTLKHHRTFVASCYARFHAPLARRLSLPAPIPRGMRATSLPQLKMVSPNLSRSPNRTVVSR